MKSRISFAGTGGKKKHGKNTTLFHLPRRKKKQEIYAPYRERNVCPTTYYGSTRLNYSSFCGYLKREPSIGDAILVL